MQRLFFALAGAMVLFLNKIRYGLRGYREPRPFASADVERAVAYADKVVSQWERALHDYSGETFDGKVVLELGPGADLGAALFLLDRGAKQYLTIDANRLVDQTPTVFYDTLLARLVHGDALKPELAKTLAGEGERIRYIVDPSFDLSRLGRESVDVVVSQAAFEHFDDVERTIAQLTDVVKSGGALVAEIDVMTHTGALRSRDPLNIYRFPRWLYRLARFNGIPNRVRPQDYRRFLEQHGWTNVNIIPLQTLPQAQLDRVRPGLAREFRDDAGMGVLTFLLMATKP